MRRIGLSLLLTLSLSTPVLAQGESDRLALSDVVLLARDNSLSAQAGRENVAAAEAERSATISNAWPTLSLQTSANYQDLPGGGLLFSSGGAGGIVGFPTNGTYVDTTLAGNLVLFDAFATRDSVAIADFTILQRQLAAVQAEQDAMTNAAVAYFQVLRAQGLADVAQNAVKNAQEHMRLGEARLKAGTGTRGDVLQLRAQLANTQQTYTQAKNAVDLARLQLSNLVNAPVGDRALDANPNVPPLNVALEHDLKAAMERRPEVQQQVARQQIDETRVSLESRALWPNLQGTTRYAQRGLNQGQFLAGVTLNWALFDGFKARNRMEAARRAAQADQTQVEQARQNVALEIRQQYQTREEARARIATAREGLAASQEAYRLGLKRYQVGLATPYELNDNQITLIQSGNNYVQAVNDLRAAEIRLARALGIDLASLVAAKK